jgi:hypothetical protein
VAISALDLLLLLESLTRKVGYVLCRDFDIVDDENLTRQARRVLGGFRSTAVTPVKVRFHRVL